MAPTVTSEVRRSSIETVRARLLTAMHVGRLRPGDRVPSVRRLADLTGLNRKTVHRAYARLADEGLLEMRPGSGTFVRRPDSTANAPRADRVLAALQRCRSEASRIGMSERDLAACFVSYFGGGLDGLPVAVVECNDEQLGLISRDLAAEIGVAPHPLSVRVLRRDPDRALGAVRAVVTTTCHEREVREVAEPRGVPVHAVALDAEFPETVSAVAVRRPVVLVVTDPTFEDVFLRLLRQMNVPDATLARIRVVPLARWPRAARSVPSDAVVSISPLAPPSAHALVPASVERLRRGWHVRRHALDHLRARLVVDSVFDTRTN